MVDFADKIERFVQLHQEAVNAGKALRLIDKRQVTRVETDGTSYIVKAYRLGLLRRILHLNVKNFGQMRRLDGLTPPVVYNGIHNGWQYLVTEDAGEQDLFHLPDADAYGQYESYFAQAGTLLGQIHDRGIYHADTKMPNFVVNTRCQGLPGVLIVDCDRLRYYGSGLPMMRRAFNLAQFLCSSKLKQPGLVELLQAFLQAYKESAHEDEAGWKTLKPLVWDIIENARSIEHWTQPEALAALREKA